MLHLDLAWARRLLTPASLDLLRASHELWRGIGVTSLPRLNDTPRRQLEQASFMYATTRSLARCSVAEKAQFKVCVLEMGPVHRLRVTGAGSTCRPRPGNEMHHSSGILLCTCIDVVHRRPVCAACTASKVGVTTGWSELVRTIDGST